MGSDDVAPAGWYPDPYDDRGQRYWDGAQWTDHVHRQAVEPEAAIAPWPAPELEFESEPDGSRDPSPLPARTRRASLVVASIIVVALCVVAWLGFRGNDKEITRVASGDTFTCALSGGQVSCWGDEIGRGLGRSTSSGRAEVLNDAQSIAAEGSRACALTPGGVISCWGPGTRHLVTTTVTGATAIATTSDHTCALTGGAVRCWGANALGQVGRMSSMRVATPTAVAGVVGARLVAVGVGFSCAVVSGGRVACWGDDRDGQLGVPGAGLRSDGPHVIPGLTGTTHLAAADGHACAATPSEVACWGRNDRGQVGTEAGSVAPPTSVRLPGVTALSASQWTTCAVGARAKVSCWGDNSFGQLGDGTRSDPRSQPTPVRFLHDTVSVSVGVFHTCAAGKGGQLQCWGGNSFGQLGDGGTRDSLKPVDVTS